MVAIIVFIERHPGGNAAALDASLRPRMIDEDAAHGLCGDTEEVRPVLPAHVALFDQLQERFVDEGGRLQRVVRALPPEIPGGLTAELAMDERHQVLQGVRLASAEIVEQAGDVVGVWF